VSWAIGRSTDSTVFTVVEGQGRSQVGDTVFDWSPHDIFVVPSWTTVTHAAKPETDAVLFAYSDRAAQDKLDVFRKEQR